MKLLVNIFLGFGLVFYANSSIGQSLSLHNTPDGIFISVNKTNPLDVNGYSIEKENTKTGKFEIVTRLEFPSSKEKMILKLEEAIKLLSFSKHELKHDQLWDSLQSKSLSPNNYFVNLPPVKLAVGTGFIDPKVTVGDTYLYRLKNNDEEIIAKSEIIEYREKIDFQEIQLYSVSESIREPYIDWYSTSQGLVRDFDVFRTHFGDTEFEKINTIRMTSVRNDTLWLKMIDTTLVSEGIHLYYIVPKDLYGNRALASLAVQVSNLTKQSLPIFTKLEANGHPLNKTMIIHWKINRHERIRSLHLLRSTKYDGEYKLVADLPPKDSIYYDPIPIANENYYYQFVINEVQGKNRKSARFFGLFKGNIAPYPPNLLNVEAFEGGISLTWESIGESVRGYYILRGKGYNSDLELISPFVRKEHGQMEYKDTSSTLKGQFLYAYAVIAESDTYTKSQPSDTLYARPKIATYISPPMELTTLIRDNKVKLIWSDHSKYENYLSGYNVWRKKVNEEKFTLLTHKMLTNTQNFYIDSTLIDESEYEYAITSLDYFGAESHHKLSGNVNLKGLLYKKPDDFWGKRSDDGIRLKWVISEVKNLQGFKLYRADDNGEFKLWKLLDPDITEIIDTDIRQGQSKFYRISSIYKDDIESEMTKPVLVRF